ncbi:hypothetical protein GQ54DRAFT_296247 [Martensiomyces pterosporus]|nr:hypothetical protein GQ54DRAFT_296247 [Martensiomyces pterosporus]
MASRLLALSSRSQQQQARRHPARELTAAIGASLARCRFNRQFNSTRAAALLACAGAVDQGSSSKRTNKSLYSVSQNPMHCCTTAQLSGGGASGLTGSTRSMTTEAWFLDKDRVSRIDAVSARDDRDARSPTAILINSLHSKPISTPRDVLDRIAEARAANSNQYLVAIIDAIRTRDSPPANTATSDTTSRPVEADRTGAGLKAHSAFKDHLMTKEVCESLLDTIAMSGLNGQESRVDTETVLAIHGVVKERGWEVESAVIQGVAIFLANSSLFGYKQSISLINQAIKEQPQQPAAIRHSGSKERSMPIFNETPMEYAVSSIRPYGLPLKDALLQKSAVLSKEKAAELAAALAGDPLDTVVEIARILADRGYTPSDVFYMSAARALCVQERESDAEWLFAAVREGAGKCSGTIHALIMAMYYRLGKASKANAVFAEFRAAWKDRWDRIQSVGVMPDAASVSSEKWRVAHEENEESSELFHAKGLRAIRRSAAAPFYCRALELLARKRFDEAAAFIKEAKYRDFVAFSPEQFGSLTRMLIAHGQVNLGYELYWETQRGANADGGRGVTAGDILFNETPTNHATGELVWSLAKMEDWDRIWLVDGDGKRGVNKALHANIYKHLISRALSTNNSYQAIKSAKALKEPARSHTISLTKTPDTWIREVVNRAMRLDKDRASASKQHPCVDFIEELLFKDMSTRGPAYLEWDARVIRNAFEVMHEQRSPASAEMLSQLFAVIDKNGLMRFPPVCHVVRGACKSVLDGVPKELQQVPQRIDDALDGWCAYLKQDSTQSSIKEMHLVGGSLLCASSSFWQCAVDTLVRGAGDSDISQTAHYLLRTLKLAYIAQAKISPLSLAAANKVLLAAKYPAVDADTGDILPLAEQIKLAAVHAQLPETFKRSTTTQTAGETNPRLWRTTQRGTAVAGAIVCNTPWKEKLRWYNACRRSHEIPKLKQLSWLVADLFRHGKRTDWEPILRDHMPEYVEALKDPSLGGPQVRKMYVETIWSHALKRHSTLGEVEEAIEYYRRVTEDGSHPMPNACACLLAALTGTDVPLPVLDKGWDGPPTGIYGVDPVLPPRGESETDLFLMPSNPAERKDLVAQIGLSMLYSILKTGKWPTTYFYNVLLGALGNSGMLKEMRHIFEVVIPTTTRAMPAYMRVSTDFMPMPFTWANVIRWAAGCGARDLAQYWFKEYRMSAMPIFREESSAFSRQMRRRYAHYARLFDLATPYYSVTSIARPVQEDGTLPTPWYDLRQAEMQIEIDRLRALDKLPLPFTGAARMLTIYTLVDEHRDMDSAEIVASEIVALSEDKALPVSAWKPGCTALAYNWKKMIDGYTEVLRHQQGLLSPDAAVVNRIKERIVYWHGMWSRAYKKAMSRAHFDRKKSDITKEQKELVERLTMDGCVGAGAGAGAERIQSSKARSRVQKRRADA